jgi:hypothetical protein
MGLMLSVDLSLLEKILKLARAQDVLSLRMPDLEITLQPKLPDLTSVTAELDDLGLPQDPGDTSLDHTSPYVPPNTKKMQPKRSKAKYSADGSFIVDEQNALNPENPVDFERDFPEMPAVAGYSRLR